MPGRLLRSKQETYPGYLESRFQAGCQSVNQLYLEIQAQVCPGLGFQLVAASTPADSATVDTLPITATSSSLPSARKLS